MSLKVTRNLPGFEGVAAGNTATVRCPIGLTYHQIYLQYSSLTLAEMEEIRVVLNGQVIARWDSGTALDAYNQYKGRAAAAGVLTIDFDRFNMRTRAAEEFTSIGTGVANDPTPVNTLAVEVDIASGATTPALSAVARQSVPRPLSLILKTRQFSYSIGGAGELEISDLPKGDIINSIFFNYSAGDLSRLKVERDNFRVFDRSRALNEVIQTDGVRVPQANYYVYDPTEDGNGAEGLATRDDQGRLINDIRFILTQITAAANYQVGVEYIGGIEV